jgi:hypothetical protein
MTPLIYIPKNELQKHNMYHHVGDTFRELAREWESRGLVEIRDTDSPHCWWGNVNDVLLCDRPVRDQWIGSFDEYNMLLCGNEPPSANVINESSWIFWGRKPKLLEEFADKYNKNYDQRPIKSIFIGKIENSVQESFRDVPLWEKYISLFDCMKNNEPYKYTQEQYLTKLSDSKFGLCLRGFGPKCNREIELLAMGVVPLLTPDVDVTYYETLKENVHFFRIHKPEDVTQIVSETTPEKWLEMSTSCREWYRSSASVQGSFDITCKVISELSLKLKTRTFRQPTSICTFCTNQSIEDLELFLSALSRHVKNIPVYILCDTITSEWLNSHTHDLNIKIKIGLDKYSGKSRAEMERTGLVKEFMSCKSICMNFALEESEDTLYMDTDILLFNTLPKVDSTKELGVCRHMIKTANEDQFGYYNAGYVYVRNKEVVQTWIDLIPTSKYDDQHCLYDVSKRHDTFEYNIQTDFGWWRLFECDGPQERLNKFSIDGVRKIILFDGKPLNSIHTHLKETSGIPYMLNFNKIIVQMMKACGSTYDYLLKHLPQQQNIEIQKPKEATVTILCQYYNDTENPERQKEIDTCFKQNVTNPYVKHVISFTEHKTVVPSWLYRDPKFTSTTSNHRLTFKRAIHYANTHLQSELICICNADIFLDSNSPWENMKPFLETPKNKRMVYAQSRHEFDGTKAYKDETLQKIWYANSQDAWFFVSPKPNIENVDFLIGTMGCDNAIAHRFKASGYVPINSPNEYKIFHYDICRNKTGANYLNFARNYEKKNNVKNSHPEEKGYYLVPDIDCIESADALMERLKMDKYQKYAVICDIISQRLKINNKK